MQFTQVSDDVVSVELSVDTLYTIANGLDMFVDIGRGNDVPVDREAALANGFKNAYLTFKGDQSVPADEEADSGLE